MYEEIAALVHEHESTPFPIGHRGIKVGNSSLTAVQSELMGYFFSFLNTNGGLGSRQLIALKNCCQQIESVRPEMTEEGRAYFDRLLLIAKKVEKQAHDQPTL